MSALPPKADISSPRCAATYQRAADQMAPPPPPAPSSQIFRGSRAQASVACESQLPIVNHCGGVVVRSPGQNTTMAYA
jgi:hypothetical protein